MTKEEILHEDVQKILCSVCDYYNSEDDVCTAFECNGLECPKLPCEEDE